MVSGIASGTLTSARVDLDVYGLRIRVTGDWPDVIEELGLDFAWFHAPPGPSTGEVAVEIRREAPDYDAFGEVPAAFVTPRNVVYQQSERTIVDYFGRALSLLDRNSGRLIVQGEDKHLVHEAAYLFLLYRIGAHLDRCKLPRLHALALVGAPGAVAVLLPAGGGKSTLALRALREEGVRLLSEDSPLIDGRGRLYPFPLRIGINATDAESMPEGHVRRLERMEFQPKLALELSAFAARIEPERQPLRHIVVGKRTLGRDARLEAVPRRAAVGTLFREAVVGVGVYQGMEFVLQRGLRDMLSQAGIAATRASCCAAGLRRARVWRLTAGRDHERNWEAVLPLLRCTG
jgi:hypothetical protein